MDIDDDDALAVLRGLRAGIPSFVTPVLRVPAGDIDGINVRES